MERSVMSDAEKVLCLRTCNADMTSYGDFRWPGEGDTVEAPDWNPGSHCGNGLHGLLWGEGDGHLLRHDQDAVWMVFEADAASVVDLGGKVKVPKATVLKTGDREAVTAWLAERAPGRAIVGASLTAGDDGTATAGDDGTATAGDDGAATAGARGTATAGYDGTATAGYAGTATAGDAGTATAADAGAATAGARGTATAGYRGTATAGYAGTATAGYAGTATAGDRGTATAGDDGTATAGDRGTIILRRWNGKRYRWVLGEIGETQDESGEVLAPGVAYRLNDDGGFVRLVPAQTPEQESGGE